MIVPDNIQYSDFTARLTTREILATTAMYGPWLPSGEFDWQSYDNLVRDVITSGSVPATNVDTTWAQFNTWDLCKQIVVRTAEIDKDLSGHIAPDRPLLVAGLNTNQEELETKDIASSIRRKVEELSRELQGVGVDRIRYMPVPDRRLIGADREVKVGVYREIGKVIGDYTDYGLVFFELDIGIPGFGSDFDLDDIRQILENTPQIQEYKSAIISAKPNKYAYPYDFRDDLARIMLVEEIAPDHVQFSTGNDWAIMLAKLGKNIKKHGYLLGASQLSPSLFRLWRELVQNDDPSAMALEHDLQAAARDFWTPGNVGIYRHYVAIFLALTGKISHPLPHPDCPSHYRVRPEDYWLPMKHAIRLGLLNLEEAAERAKQFIPGADEMPKGVLLDKVRLTG